MTCTNSEAVHFWTYAPILSHGAMRLHSIDKQVEAFDELDTLAAVTLDAGLRQRCLSVLTTRPDIAVLSKLGSEPGGEVLLELFRGEYLEHPRDEKQVPVDVCKTYSDAPRRPIPPAEPAVYDWVQEAETEALIAALPVLPWRDSDPSRGNCGAPVFHGDRLVSVYFR